MLTLIQDDGDSFAQRAEMYYKKRPQLIKMVEDFHKSHRCLAERYDQLRSEYTLQLPRSTSSISSDSLKHAQDIHPKNLNDHQNHNANLFSRDLLDSNPESTVEDPNPNLDHDDDFSNNSVTSSGKLQIPSSKPSSKAGFRCSSSSAAMDLNISTVFDGLVKANEEKRETIKELNLQIKHLAKENEALRRILFPERNSSRSSRSKEGQSRTSRWKGLLLGKLRGS
ncbi:hypothetical protein ACLOJK_002203 [Asimina triloba]